MRTPLLISLPAVLLFSSFLSGSPKPKLPKEFVRIPAGTTYLPKENVAGHFVHDSQVVVSISGFFMSKYEVSNKQYREFLSDVSGKMKTADLNLLMPDTSLWSREPYRAKPMEQHYFRHPSFDDYPVLGISYEGASAYCEWMRKKVRANNPGLEVVVKLPSKAEWVYAAQGGRSQAMFPWSNYYLRNKQGEPMCNFRMVYDQSIYRNRKTGDPEVAVGADRNRTTFTSTVKSFSANDYGLYNMCGNAAEMITEKGTAMGGSWNDYGGDVHILAKQYYSGGSPMVGFRPLIIFKEKQ